MSPYRASEWHARFMQQAGWTAQIRRYLFQKSGILGEKGQSLLEVGCGTGALLVELLANGLTQPHGLDIAADYLNLARCNAPGATLVQGDAHALPYRPGAFAHTCCHFLLLWTGDAAQVVAEMRRVTRPGGSVMALAEPDYGGRIDFPPALAAVGEMQAESLRRQGADPETGRRLAGYFSQAGLVEVEFGVLGGQWNPPVSEAGRQLENAVLRADLDGLLPAAEIEAYLESDAAAWQNGERVLFIPHFYAWGRVGDR